jgi:hypothetical protein
MTGRRVLCKTEERRAQEEKEIRGGTNQSEKRNPLQPLQVQTLVDQLILSKVLGS